MVGSPILYEELTAPQIKSLIDRGMDMVIWPMGATEQHGGHLPLNVDTLIPEKIAYAVSSETGVPVFPALAFGQSSSHSGFPGTLSLRPETFQMVVEEVGEWAYATGLRRMLFLNGNLPNLPPLNCAVVNLRIKCPELKLRALNWWDITPELTHEMYGDSTCGLPHGNIVETSVMRYLRDELVNMKEATPIGGQGEKVFFYYLLRQVSRTGHCGDPSRSTVELGEDLFRKAVDGLVPLVRAALREEPPEH